MNATFGIKSKECFFAVTSAMAMILTSRNFGGRKVIRVHPTSLSILYNKYHVDATDGTLGVLSACQCVPKKKRARANVVSLFLFDFFNKTLYFLSYEIISMYHPYRGRLAESKLIYMKL